MPGHDFTATRLFVEAPLGEGTAILLDRGRANYLLNVLRLKPGDEVLVFNGREGEWRAALAEAAKKAASLSVVAKVRDQTPAGDLHYVFAPLKHARLDYLIQKAVEMGVSRLRPVITRHTQVTRLNLDRARANAIEAAEQCGILSIPEIDELVPLASLLDAWPHAEPGRHLVFCDEGDAGADAMSALRSVPDGPLAVLVGPEGGFAAEERRLLRALPFVTPLPLGPRILRADTAAVAALALVQAVRGDWRV